MKFGNSKGQAAPQPNGQPNPNRDLMMKFANSGMTTAMGSGSPLLAAVAPLLAALMMRQGGGAGGAGAMAPFMSGFESSNEDLAAFLDDPNLPEWRREFYVEEMERRRQADRNGGAARPRPGYTPVKAPGVTPAPDVKPTPSDSGQTLWQWMWGTGGDQPPAADPLGLGSPPGAA